MRSRLLVLFWEFFKISLFVIGGGYSIIVVADQVFARKGWIREDELIEHLPVFQMVPGLIATHTAVYVGDRVAGRLGALVGVTAVAIPSIVIFTAVSVWYGVLPIDNAWLNSAFVGLRAALTGIIAATVVKSWKRFMTDAFAYALLVAGVTALVLVRVPVVAVLLASMACGLASLAPCAPRVRFHSFLLWPLLYFLQYGALCFGGGFVIVPMYLTDFVGPNAPYLQLSCEEFSNVMAVSQMTPGPIGVNCATFFGYRLAGVLGALVASALLLLPGSLMAWLVFRSLERFKASRVVKGIMRGIRPASIALMLVALSTFAKITVVDADGAFHVWGAILIALALLIFMKKKLNVILLIILCACAACVLRADEEVSVERFPDADSVTISECEHVEYLPDGTSVSQSETWSRILTERGRRNESELRLGYSKRYGSARIVHVGAVGTNGVERTIDVSGTTKDMTDNASLSQNIVDPLDREIVCTIPGLQIGETVHVKIERRTVKSRVRDQWSDVSVFEWTHPILKSVYEVKAPKERPIRSRAIRHPLGNLTEEIKPQPDGSTLYVYTATNSPRMFPEPDMPPQWTQVQSVHLSTANDWSEISRWYWEVCEPHLAATTADMTNMVARLGRDPSRIFKFVSQEIRYMGLTMEDVSPGYAPHDVRITFDNRYGVCRDKAALLVALLRIAGHPAYPVLINVGAKMDPDVPKPYFNHAIVAVEKAPGEYALMDPTNENTKDPFPAYLCNCSYLVARKEGDVLRVSPVPSPESNAVSVTTSGLLRDDGSMVVECALDFAGINDTVYRGALARATAEQRVKFFERRLSSLCSGAKLIRCLISPRNVRDTSTPLHVDLLAELPSGVLRGKESDILNVPFVSRAFSLSNWLLAGNTALEKRRYPLVLDTTARVCEDVRIDLGTALGEVLSLPQTIATTNDYAYARSFSVSNGTLVAQRSLTLGSVEISPSSYAKMREDIKAVEAVERKNPIFKSDQLKNADVRLLLDSVDVDIVDGTSWCVTNTLVKEVLTYRGKKDSAEMKFTAHPAWKCVRVLSASVSNLNGTVSHVKPVEINEIDVNWTASAPRYPAGKTIVVNLPAVEIGSVISVTTVTTVTNAPAPFYASFSLDSKNPLERCHVRVDDQVREVLRPRRIADEPSQPAAWLWRDVMTVSKCSFAETAEKLRRAADVEPYTMEDVTDVRAIRDWMARNVRLAGPSLYELPIENQLSDPKVVISERYATRLDYIRTLCALLRGAGYEADIVFAARNAERSDEYRRRDQVDYPNVRAYASALCRVRVREGGFLGFGGRESVYYLGTENEYTPLEASGFENCSFYDPTDESFGIVRAADRSFASCVRQDVRVTVRDSGAVDYAFRSRFYGASVGGFRKRYAEILPEDFSRHFQQLLGGVSQAATATRELTPDTTGYPASLSFECFIPDFAIVDGDTITVRMPELECPFSALTGSVRRTPIDISAEDEAEETIVIRFPEGYDEIESIPEDFTFADPKTSETWLSNVVTHRIVDGCLEVSIVRHVRAHTQSFLGAEYAGLLRDWRQRATADEASSFVVRRKRR